MNEFPRWFLWMLEKPYMLILMGLIVAGGFIGIALYIDQRIETIETRLDYLPPSSYEPPDLEALKPNPELAAEGLPEDGNIYAPAYSHLFYQGGVPYPLEITLSIRNIDPDDPVLVDRVEEEPPLAEAGEQALHPPGVEVGGGGALEAGHHPRLVALGLQPADEPRPGVRQRLVVEVDRVLR